MTEKNKPGWVTSYNFASLLNVPKAMEEMGPLIDLWEGKFQGEGIVRPVKLELVNGLRRGWQKRLLQNLLTNKALRAIMRRFDKGKDSEENDGLDVNQSLHAHTYACELDVRKDYTLRKPLSVVRLVDGRYGCVIRGKQLLLLFPENDATRNVNDLHYQMWTIGNSIDFSTSTAVASSLLLLPILRAPKTTGVYAAINSRWEELGPDGVFHLPQHIRDKDAFVEL